MFFEKIKDNIKDLKQIGEGWKAKIYAGYYNGLLLSFKIPIKKDYTFSIKKEGIILKELNKYNIGAKLHLLGEDFIAYKYIEGKPLNEVLNKENSKILLSNLLNQARKLDILKINKEEMHKPYSNVLVTDNYDVYLIDFERASKTLSPKNVTQLITFFLNNKDLFEDIDKDKIINLLKIYKNGYSEDIFIKLKNEFFK